MRFSRVPPGEHPDADAFNLIVASCFGDQKTAETIGSRVKDWVPVAAYLAGYASIVINKVNESNPQVMDILAESIDAKYRAEINQPEPV